MEAKDPERRYNTRFRGVPRSVFSYTHNRRKSSTKANDENHLRTDIRDDYVYPKMGKKSHQSREGNAKIKNEVPLPNNTTSSTPVPNGTHEEKVKSYKKEVPQLKLPESISKETKQKNVPPKKNALATKAASGIVPTDLSTKRLNENIENSHLPERSNGGNHLPKKRKNHALSNGECLSPKPNAQSLTNPEDLSFKNNSHDTPHSDDGHTDKSPVALSNLGQLAEMVNNHPIGKEDSDEESPELSPKGMEGLFFEPNASEGIYTSSNATKSNWVGSKEKLSFNNQPVADYNPKTKMFRCVACQAIGFMSRIGEHFLGTHCDTKPFQCPQCSYTSAWWRCVRNHMSKNHGISNAPASIWKDQPLLDEIMQLLQNLKSTAEAEELMEKTPENFGKRYVCPKCPYATDRRDLYNRHENIHREEKPFQCYICYKLFNRADHVKKHFCRIHKEFEYDINLIRRLPSKRSRIPTAPPLNGDILPKQKPAILEQQSKLASDIPPTQSHLFNYLTGSPTMVKMNREIDHIPPYPLEKEFEPYSNSVTKNDNTFNNSHSNLLTYITQNAFQQKQRPFRPPMEPSKDILQGALMRPRGGYVPPYHPGPVHHGPPQFSCPHCPWTGPNAWALRLHASIHYRKHCGLCSFRCSESTDIEKHMWEVHEKRSCVECTFLADNSIQLDLHYKEAHSQKSQFPCRHCSQSFEVRSDMEAHCIFIHSQTLQECKDNSCDFCTTDSDILKAHMKEVHSAELSFNSSATRTLCLYCGCDFADVHSRALHEELFHENPLQAAGRRPLKPYGCSVCGHAVPKQPMMIEHMRVHTGQLLRCRAGGGCMFDTPYDTVLQEHVRQVHSDGPIDVPRCPHCAFLTTNRESFVAHYHKFHHQFCCSLCEEVESRHFVQPPSSAAPEFAADIAAMFPFARSVAGSARKNADATVFPFAGSSNNLDGAMFPFTKSIAGTTNNVDATRFPFAKSIVGSANNTNAAIVRGNVGVALSGADDCGRRSRKQMQPRKIVTPEGNDLPEPGNSKNKRFLSLYAKKYKELGKSFVFKCRLCRWKLYFRHKKNYLIHRLWHSSRKFKCQQCVLNFSHRYQVLLHRREHRETRTS